MALINTAAIMARRGFRVLVIDLDLEAPGLSFLAWEAAKVDAATQKRPLASLRGFIDLFNDVKARGEESDLFALPIDEVFKIYTSPYPLPPVENAAPDGSLCIMPAGNLDRDYTKRFDELNMRGLYEEGLGEPLIRIFKKKIVESTLYDFVLIDSRTGFSDEAGICTRDLADSLVILSGLNRQNIEGTSRFLNALHGETEGNAKFEVVLSPVPNGEDDLMYEREKIAQKSFSAAWGQEINLSLQIPYHPRLALTEEPHILRQKRGALSDAYRAIERRILATLKLDMPNIVPLLLKSLRDEDYSTVLDKLKMLVRLDGKEQGLGRVLNSLLINPKPKNNESKELPSLMQILKHETGKEVVFFIIKHIDYDAGDLMPLTLHNQLEKIDPSLANTMLIHLI